MYMFPLTKYRLVCLKVMYLCRLGSVKQSSNLYTLSDFLNITFAPNNYIVTTLIFSNSNFSFHCITFVFVLKLLCYCIANLLIQIRINLSVLRFSFRFFLCKFHTLCNLLFHHFNSFFCCLDFLIQLFNVSCDVHSFLLLLFFLSPFLRYPIQSCMLGEPIEKI